MSIPQHTYISRMRVLDMDKAKALQISLTHPNTAIALFYRRLYAILPA